MCNSLLKEMLWQVDLCSFGNKLESKLLCFAGQDFHLKILKSLLVRPAHAYHLTFKMYLNCRHCHLSIIFLPLSYTHII